MAYKPIEKVEYSNSYEKQRALLPKLFYCWSDEGEFIKIKGEHTSFFLPHELDLSDKDASFIKDYNKNRLPQGTNINGRVKVVPKPDYKVEMPIKEVFTLVQDLMVTKSKVLRKSMESLKPWDRDVLASLLHYIRTEWEDGERGDVILTYQEYYLIKPNKTVAKKK